MRKDLPLVKNALREAALIGRVSAGFVSPTLHLKPLLYIQQSQSPSLIREGLWLCHKFMKNGAEEEARDTQQANRDNEPVIRRDRFQKRNNREKIFLRKSGERRIMALSFNHVPIKLFHLFHKSPVRHSLFPVI